MRRKITVFSVILVFFLQNSVFAQEARLSDVIISNSRNDLMIYLKVEGAFTEKMRKAIFSGVSTTFSFLITMERLRGMWMNEEIAGLKLEHTIKYDNLKKEFTVRRSWENDKATVTQSFAEAKKLMCEVENIRLSGLDKLQKGLKYQIRAKAELSEITLPFYLHYILFFVAMWKFETEWYMIDFTY